MITPEDERSIRDSERARLKAALLTFLQTGGGSFRRFIAILGMDYSHAYDEGWMDFTNALSEHEDRISRGHSDP